MLVTTLIGWNYFPCLLEEATGSERLSTRFSITQQVRMCLGPLQQIGGDVLRLGVLATLELPPLPLGGLCAQQVLTDRC
jgi:hypothetical protein